MSLRGLFFALLTLSGATLSAPLAAADDIPNITDLRSEARISQQKRLPILLMFSGEHCTYCIRLEEDFLKPMHNGGYYDEKVLIRRARLGDNTIIDFDGNKTTTSELASRYNVSLTPTVVLIDGKGRQLTQKLVGLTTPDLYGGYLDQAIDTALDRMRRTKPIAVKVTD